MLNFIKNLSPTELGLIALILIILFGAKVVMRMARTSGESFREIKKIKKSFTDAIEGEEPQKDKQEGGV